MIRPLRARHRLMILVVGFVAAILLIAGLLARRPTPKMDRLPVPVGAASYGESR